MFSVLRNCQKAIEISNDQLCMLLVDFNLRLAFQHLWQPPEKQEGPHLYVARVLGLENLLLL